MSSRFCMAIRPTARISRGRMSSIWRSQVRQAGGHFGRRRITIPGRPALEDVGDIDVPAPREADGPQHGIQQLSGPAHERLALTVPPRRPAPRPPPAIAHRRSPTPSTGRVRVRCSSHRVQRATSSVRACQAGSDPEPGVARQAAVTAWPEGTRREAATPRYPAPPGSDAAVDQHSQPSWGGPRNRRRRRRPTHSRGADAAYTPKMDSSIVGGSNATRMMNTGTSSSTPNGCGDRD